MIAWSERLSAGSGGPVVDLYFTDAVGGASRAPYGGFNLGAHVGDDPAAVGRNRTTLAQEVAVGDDRIVWMNQVHGAEVARVQQPWRGDPPGVDGVVTDESDLALAVLVADCTPVLLADPAAGVVGAVHAGRPGMLAGVVPAAIEQMRQAGASSPVAVVGPSVCGRCYEVPAQMREDAARTAPASSAVSWSGTPAIDVASGVVSQLADHDVPVTWLPGCTRERKDLFSYRRARTTGRFAGVVVLRASS